MARKAQRSIDSRKVNRNVELRSGSYWIRLSSECCEMGSYSYHSIFTLFQRNNKMFDVIEEERVRIEI